MTETDTRASGEAPSVAAQAGDASGGAKTSQRPTPLWLGWLVGAYLVGATLAAFYLFLKLWPRDLSPGSQATWREVEFILHWPVPVNPEVRILALIVCAGALGGLLHGLRSYADFLGNRRLFPSWVGWYVARPFVGSILALVFYLLIRGGLVPGGSDGAGALSIVGFAGASALIGLFSEQALAKLKEVFAALFSTHAPDDRGDKLTGPQGNPTPELQSIDPGQVAAGSGEQSVRLTGSNFVAASQASIDGAPRPTRLNEDGSLTLTLQAPDVASPGERTVAVTNPAPGGGTSGKYPLRVT